MEEREVRPRLTPAPRWAAAVLGGAVLVLVTLAALGARGLPGNETRPPPFPVDLDLLVVFRIMMGILAGLMVLLIILLLLPGGPPIQLPERKRSSPFKLLGGIVLLFAILMILQPFADRTEEETVTSGTGKAVTETDTTRIQQSGSRWGLIILGGAVLLVVLGVAAVARPGVEPEETVETTAPARVAGVIDSILAELEESTDPREVVIGAYARMERALMAAGVPRHPSEAPLEYLARSLRRLHVGRAAITRLTALFELARFSDHDILPDMGREAVAALSNLRSELSEVTT
ncbi:MAG: DUF4129 domain-containing protein [Acidimicrobiia bacterium]|nr:DUF4129 domain-containing protein [Acidimicrobiia bacterium]